MFCGVCDYELCLLTTVSPSYSIISESPKAFRYTLTCEYSESPSLVLGFDISATQSIWSSSKVWEKDVPKLVALFGHI